MNLISAIFTVLTVIVGGISIMLFVSTKTLRDSRDDLDKRVKYLEDERTRDQDTIAEQNVAIKFWRSAATGDEKLDSLVAQFGALLEQQQSHSELVAGLTELLTRHHHEAQSNWVMVNTGLSHVGTAIDHMSDSLDALNELTAEAQKKQGGKA